MVAHHRHRMRRAVGQHLGDRRLETAPRCRRRPARGSGPAGSGDQLRDGGFQAGEAEVAAGPPQQRARQRIAPWIAASPPAVPAPVRLASPARAVSPLCRTPRRPRRRWSAEPPVAADALDRDALAMPAGDQQQQVGKRRAVRDQAGQARGQRVRLQVVDRDERQRDAQRDALGRSRMPTIRPPINPGPLVAGDAPRSRETETPACHDADRPGPAAAPDGRARRFPAPRRRTARAPAGSARASARIRPSASSTAAAVSSQERLDPENRGQP